MIPHSLTLRHFLSYRDAVELDLRDLRLACISGSNGAGKSTILDGITWALFGKSRARSDDDVVNRVSGPHGATAEVVFVFELEGAIYRVIRRKGLGKTAELEFHAQIPGDKGKPHWQALTEARMRETQAEIEKLLRMNYDVFTNASFLLQGKADEFTTKTADRRKEILAEILGVSRWDEYKEKATERRKEAELEAASLERQLDEIDAELALEDEYSRALELAEAKTKAAIAERDRQEALVASARQNKTLADQQRDSLRRATAELEESERELQDVEGASARRRAELAGFRALIDRRDAIAAAFADWQAAEADYADWQERAERHAAIARESHPLEMAIARAETQLEQRTRELETRAERVKSAAAQRDELLARLAADEGQRDALAKRAAELAEREHEWHDSAAHLEKLGYERKLLHQEYVRLSAQAGEIANQEQEREQVEASRRAVAEALATARESLLVLEGKRQALAEKTAEKNAVDAEQSRLREGMDDIKANIARLRAEAEGECPLCGQPLTDEHREKVLSQLQAEGEKSGAQFRRNKAALGVLAEEIETLTAALQRQPILEKDRETQQAAVSRAELRLHAIEVSLVAWRESPQTIRLAEVETLLADDGAERELRARIELLQSVAGEHREAARALAELEKQIARSETQIEEVERLQREWESDGRPALKDARRQLAAKSFAAAERAALDEIQARLAAVGFDEARHTAARARRDALAAAPREQQQLLQAEAAVKPLADALADLDGRRERIVARVADLRTQREQTARLLEELEAGLGDLRVAEAELQRLREEAIAAIRAEGGAKQKLQALATRREDRQKLTAAKTAAARRLGLLRQLEIACGRKGVQALLIEQALPELEEYTNNLLYDLTGGEMRVTFETQQPKKGKQDSFIETLDIKISDSTGERPYENYSGGEKFRINFAVRLALSQVLARRAGARLRTLVIDEGFGNQDPDGRQRLVEAINTVQEQFACILVITHIDELRDKFPARIDVEKTANGSSVSVVTL